MLAVWTLSDLDYLIVWFIETTSKKKHRNNVDFSLIKITSKKVRRNDVDFLPNEITSKK